MNLKWLDNLIIQKIEIHCLHLPVFAGKAYHSVPLWEVTVYSASF